MCIAGPGLSDPRHLYYAARDMQPIMEVPMRSPRSSQRPASWRYVVPTLGLALLVACSGGNGCGGSGMGGLHPIKGGFPVAQRQENAVELRLSQGLFTFIQ